MVNLRKITEENFIDAFNLKLGKSQERFVSHPIRSLAQAYVYRDQCQPFGIQIELRLPAIEIMTQLWRYIEIWALKRPAQKMRMKLSYQ